MRKQLRRQRHGFITVSAEVDRRDQVARITDDIEVAGVEHLGDLRTVRMETEIAMGRAVEYVGWRRRRNRVQIGARQGNEAAVVIVAVAQRARRGCEHVVRVVAARQEQEYQGLVICCLGPDLGAGQQAAEAAERQ